MSNFVTQDNRGAAALVIVVILGAAALIIGYSASMLGLGELEMGYDEREGGESYSIAEGCVEEAMRQLRIDDSYSGGSLSLGAGSCIISVSGVDDDRTVLASSTVGEYGHTIEIELTIIDSIIIINSWENI